ncbi:MAG: amino acid deaminase/aldolase [Acidobacteriota bacterium]|nr:amino acid deaminase/aldolase [Acidobacteriota bacterium]
MKINVTRDYGFYSNVFQGIPKPFAFVDLDVLDANLVQVIERTGGKSIRPATKSLRCRVLIDRVLQAHPAVRGLLCFSAAEAVLLSDQGYDDLLVAYPTVESRRLEEVAARVAAGKRITLMVDCHAQLEVLSRIAAGAGVVLPLCLDVDMSTPLPGLYFGVFRSPVADVASALELYRDIAGNKHLRLDGVMGYEAQIAGVQDNLPGQGLKNRVIRFLKKRSLPKVAQRRARVVKALRDAGADLKFVNGGGTGSVQSTVKEETVTEVTVGSGFYSSHLFDYFQDFRYAPAAGFALEVVRSPRDGVVTCLGGGYIASGKPGWDKVPLPWLPEGMRYMANEGAGEVQTPLRLNGFRPEVGDPVFFRHAKAGELCERFNELFLVQDGKVIDKVPTYRGEGWCFL